MVGVVEMVCGWVMRGAGWLWTVVVDGPRAEVESNR